MDDKQNQNTEKLVIPPEIKSYLEGILSDAKMTFADASMREEMTNELFTRLDSYLTSVIVDKMPPENMDEFMKMNEDKKPKEEIENYMREKIPNTQEVMTKAFMDFRDMYLRNVTVAKNAPNTEGGTS